MRYTVYITLAAWRDLEEITDWVAENDSPAHANFLLDRLLQTAESVAESPHRGSRPAELPAGINAEFRQFFFKPYRIVYKIAEDRVIIYLIADGRRSLQSILLRRLSAG